jgi:hypothetical protein
MRRDKRLKLYLSQLIIIIYLCVCLNQVVAKAVSFSATTATACPVRKSATEFPTAHEAKTNSIAVSLHFISSDFCC